MDDHRLLYSRVTGSAVVIVVLHSTKSFADAKEEGRNEMTRKTDVCINCGETREMAAHGLCFKCYRKEDRADDRQFAGVDRHNRGIRREHKKLFRGFTSVMVGLSNAMPF